MKRDSMIGFIWLVGIVSILGFFYWLVGHYVTLESLQAHSRMLRVSVEQHYLLSALEFIAACAIAAFLSLPLTILLAILGGFLFGTLLGALYAIVGITIGSTLAFLILRHFFATRLRTRYAVRFAPLFAKIEQYGSMYLFILYFLAVVPFFIINAFAAVTSIATKVFVVVTLLGNIPLFMMLSFIGRRLSEINSVHDVFSGPMLIVFGLLIVLAAGSAFIKQRMRHHKGS
jgi:uncharacterized membrane protein YdjX (TVP38/TMEM64 family)